MWAAAGNAWILADNPGRAAAALDKALATPGLDQAQVGFAELDRARAAEMQGNFKAARTFAAKAKDKIPDDPFVWYFSAALALREDDVPAAPCAGHVDRARAILRASCRRPVRYWTGQC